MSFIEFDEAAKKWILKRCKIWTKK